ncbi:hypothetical protein DP115_16260 [Brasilonema octagenarum UFV-OR1]|uniref:Uncharacterized protein n=1 Tax=Brasilonema octagenarum UFV-OR1 TaxID=417115 RepID=A0ABX1M6T1_9CYAN|nr:hypothetical protein [Brasilonema octagenarum UFV-OR1]
MDILDGQKSNDFPSDIKGIARSAARQLVLPSGNARRQAALENATCYPKGTVLPYQERAYSS